MGAAGIFAQNGSPLGPKLRDIEFLPANPICGHLKAVFEKGHAPTGENHFPQAFVAVL
jgi:hypothetical protein